MDTMSDFELEYHTCRAFGLASRWISGRPIPRRTLYIDAIANTSVYGVRFVPGHAGDWILTLSKSVWDALTIWDLSARPQKLCEWSPRGGIFSGMSLNTETNTNTIVAISLLKDGWVCDA